MELGKSTADQCRTIHCDKHGDRRQAYVCDHLLRGTSQGFFSGDDPGNPHPDAWCSKCEEIRLAHGSEWNAESEALLRAGGPPLRFFCKGGGHSSLVTSFRRAGCYRAGMADRPKRDYGRDISISSTQRTGGWGGWRGAHQSVGSGDPAAENARGMSTGPHLCKNRKGGPPSNSRGQPVHRQDHLHSNQM